MLGRFRIVRLLGRGGMGQVFEAEDLQLGRIALKTIRPDLASSTPAFDRFRREVQLARKVSGAQVCRIHDLFLIPADGQGGGSAFLTMEYLDGETLAARLQKSGAMARREALQVALDICDGLRLIHQQGVVHRDLKSANIMLCEREGQMRAVVMDFGLALDSVGDAGTPDDSTATDVPARTETGAIAGTPAYMAPEQFEGKAVSPATDIYALGVVLYELLTGRQPFAADTPVGAAIRRARRPDPVSSVQHKIPRHWDRVIERCLEYEPERRYQSAEQAARALRAGPLDIHNLAADRPWLLRGAAALLLIFAVWGIFAWWQTRQYYRPNAEAEKSYQMGLASLREASYLKATRELGDATTQDSRFVMAHARLAEAWSNLDFDGTAKQEMLIASAGENHLSPLDHMYLDAIRATLTRNFKGALDQYRKILDRLPAADKAAGYVDVGMAYERANEPQEALASYAKASALDRDNPAPYLRAAIVETRQNRVQDANRDFDRAEAIYKTEMNPEGLAELDYQRGYLANQRGDTKQAGIFLQHAIDEAQRIASPQLEIRALEQLSSSECPGNCPEAAEKAQRAIGLARDNQLDAWAARGLARLAYVRLLEGSDHFEEAEEAVQQARSLAIKSGQGRAEAFADLILANLRESEGRPAEVIPAASAALAYYRQNGDFELAADATLLILHTELGRGDIQQALQQSTDFLGLAEESGNPDLVMEAEENLGTTYEYAERYPEAVTHFQKALTLASGNDTYRAYYAVSYAEALIRLGDFAQANALLSSAAAVPSLAVSSRIDKVDSLLEQGRYDQALTAASALINGHPQPGADSLRDLERRRAVAEAHLRRSSQALADWRNAVSNGGRSDDPKEQSDLALQRAEVESLTGQPDKALADATAAEGYFASKGMPDSDLRASLVAASASQALHSIQMSSTYSAKAIDILTALRHNWGPQSVQTYLSRADLRTLMRVLPRGSQTHQSVP
ncbi:MAG TPA: protein kinase [Acidobacteriaceae bacterium]|nr:protein kinase [Acidobacteriaceae bacterium]